MNSIRLIIERLLKRTGASQADIARLLGVPEKTLNAWLTGRVTCRHEQMLGLALEALSARLSTEGKMFNMSRTLKDEVVVASETRRLTAEISGTSGRRIIAIYLDGEYEDHLEEWSDSWYYKLGDDKPTSKHIKIGATPEEALNWWVRTRGVSWMPQSQGMPQRHEMYGGPAFTIQWTPYIDEGNQMAMLHANLHNIGSGTGFNIHIEPMAMEHSVRHVGHYEFKSVFALSEGESAIIEKTERSLPRFTEWEVKSKNFTMALTFGDADGKRYRQALVMDKGECKPQPVIALPDPTRTLLTQGLGMLIRRAPR